MVLSFCRAHSSFSARGGVSHRAPLDSAIAELAGDVDAATKSGAIDCGLLNTNTKEVRRCSIDAFRNQRHFFWIRRGFVTNASRHGEPPISGAMFGDREGNVRTVWISDPNETPTIGCGVVDRPIVRPKPDPRMAVIVQQLARAGAPTREARQSFLAVPPKATGVLAPDDAKEGEESWRRTFFATLDVDAAGRVTGCYCSHPSVYFRLPVCAAAMRWTFIPATFLGRPFSSTHDAQFASEGRKIQVVYP